MADAHVRVAGPGDVAEIARIQLAVWETAYSAWLPAQVLQAVTAEQAAASWRSAVTAPPTPRHRVLVALEQDWLVGFAAFATAEDGTAEVQTLLVEPRWGRRGHGSRLLAATVDHLRADGARTATVWVPERDAASVRFYESAGWERDGYARALDAGGPEIHEVRLHVSVAEDGEEEQ